MSALPVTDAISSRTRSSFCGSRPTQTHRGPGALAPAVTQAGEADRARQHQTVHQVRQERTAGHFRLGGERVAQAVHGALSDPLEQRAHEGLGKAGDAAERDFRRVADGRSAVLGGEGDFVERMDSTAGALEHDPGRGLPGSHDVRHVGR
jgi:hypothetical protein